MRKRFGVPIFHSTDKLIKHAVKDNNMDWSYRDTELYTHAWQNPEGTDLWIEDVTQMLSPTDQTQLTNFDEDRYRVLEQRYHRPEASLQETFQELEDAENYVEDNYNIDI